MIILKVCISANYEEKHYLQMREIARRIADLGGKYCMYATECSLFVTYDYVKADGTLKNCSRLAHVKEVIEKKGKLIEILPFADFLELIGTTEEELDSLVPEDEPSVETAEMEVSEEMDSAEEADDLEQIPAVNA